MTTNPAYPHIHITSNQPLASIPIFAAIVLATALEQDGIRGKKIGHVLREVAQCEPGQVLATVRKYVHVTEGQA